VFVPLYLAKGCGRKLEKQEVQEETLSRKQRFSFMCVCPLDIYTDTNVKPINRRSCDSRILIDKRRIRTSSAENVCVECGCISNTAWGARSSNITLTKWKILKFKAGLPSFWPMKTVFCAVFESLTDITGEHLSRIGCDAVSWNTY